MRRAKAILTALAVVAVAAGCANAPEIDLQTQAPRSPAATPSQAPPAKPLPPAAPTPAPCDPVAQIAAMPLDVRLRQLLFVGVSTTGAAPIDDALEAARAGVGGINFLGGAPQVYADGQLAAVTAAAAIGPFLAIDQEGGRVQRLKALIGSQPSARTMGATMTLEAVAQLGAVTATAMSALGLSMDFAPVVDVSGQPAKAVIGDRSFSVDPAVVGQYAAAYGEGLRSGGIIPVLKHFPGIGSASGHTDEEPATTPALEELIRSDLLPYPTLLTRQPVAVMMGNAAVPGLTDGAPASLSPAAIDLLRTTYGFQGVVLTDSLTTGSIEHRHSLPEAAELAITAGVDMVLWDTIDGIESVTASLSEALAAGRLTTARVNESVARVLALKGVNPCAGVA